MECTNPQYIVRATDQNYHTEIFAIAPGASPAIVNEIPPGQPTVPNGPEDVMLQAITDILVSGGFCKAPETLDTPDVEEVEDTSSEANIPSGLGALGKNMARRAQTRAVEEIPGTPSVYLDKVQNVDAPGSAGGVMAAVIAIPFALAGGRLAVNRVQQQMFPVTIQPEVQNYESEQPQNIYTRPQHVASVSAVPAHEPSPWARPSVHAGNPHQTGHFGRNDSPKWTRNESEMTSEMEIISPEMSSVDTEQLSRVRSRLSNLFQNSETPSQQVISVEMESEMKPISGYFDPDGDLSEAKSTYFMLRSNGVHTATDLGGAIFGIRGGDKWAKVSPILRDWSSEWESSNGTGVS